MCGVIVVSGVVHCPGDAAVVVLMWLLSLMSNCGACVADVLLL